MPMNPHPNCDVVVSPESSRVNERTKWPIIRLTLNS